MASTSQQHYLQVIDYLKQDIELEVFAENDRLPSEFELAQKYSVSRTTLRKALNVLEDEQVLIRRHGVGIFVNPKPLFTSGIEQLSSVSAMIRNAGMEPGTIFVEFWIQIQQMNVYRSLTVQSTTK